MNEDRGHIAKGYTLVEVMVASLLFAIVMLYGLSFFVYGAKPMVRAQEYDFALNVAKTELEMKRALRFSNLCGFAEGAGLSAMNEIWEFTPARGTNFYIDNNGITYTAETEALGFKTGNGNNENERYYEFYAVVTTTVSWTSPGSKKPERVILPTVIAPTPDFYGEQVLDD